jgi:hypothetical protein
MSSIVAIVKWDISYRNLLHADLDSYTYAQLIDFFKLPSTIPISEEESLLFGCSVKDLREKTISDYGWFIEENHFIIDKLNKCAHIIWSIDRQRFLEYLECLSYSKLCDKLNLPERVPLTELQALEYERLEDKSDPSFTSKITSYLENNFGAKVESIRLVQKSHKVLCFYYHAILQVKASEIEEELDISWSDVQSFHRKYDTISIRMKDGRELTYEDVSGAEPEITCYKRPLDTDEV